MLIPLLKSCIPFSLVLSSTSGAMWFTTSLGLIPPKRSCSRCGLSGQDYNQQVYIQHLPHVRKPWCHFFQVGNATLVPGKVCSIFLVKQDSTLHVFLAVHCFSHLKHLCQTFFMSPRVWYKFMVIWDAKRSNDCARRSKFYHAIYQDWEYKIMVMKPLNRVSNIYCLRWKMADLLPLGLLSPQLGKYSQPFYNNVWKWNLT